MHRSAVAYRKVHVESAPPDRLLDELYQRLLRDMHLARTAVTSGDIIGKAKSVSHALAIVAELRAALDDRASPALCVQLASLYEFVRQRLLAASAKMDLAALGEAERIIRLLADAFRTASEAR